MSVTDILKTKRLPELKLKLKEVFPKPIFKLSSSIVAPPLTKNYSIVGTAFDYLMRFFFERNFPQDDRDLWVAENAYDKIDEYSKRIKSSITFEKRRIDAESFKDQVKSRLRKARENYFNYLETGIFDEEILYSSLFLAQMDVIFRAAYFDPKFGYFDPSDVEDLKALVNVLEGLDVSSYDRVFLNPTFGSGSELVRGADADIVMDDFLLDIKTTKNLTLPREYFNQLIIYYILSLIGGLNGEEEVSPIKRIGIYYSRFGVIWSASIEDIADIDKVNDFKKWFIDYMEERYWAGTRID